MSKFSKNPDFIVGQRCLYTGSTSYGERINAKATIMQINKYSLVLVLDECYPAQGNNITKEQIAFISEGDYISGSKKIKLI